MDGIYAIYVVEPSIKLLNQISYNIESTRLEGKIIGKLLR